VTLRPGSRPARRRRFAAPAAQGTFYSQLAVLERGDAFHAAVAGAPVTEWEDYDTHYTERYLGVPPKAKEAYARSSLLPRAPKLGRPLLLVHGTFPKDKAFLRETKSAEALRTLAPLVSDEVHHGKSPLSPRAWGPFLEFINQSAH
jgi:hypothetical protein